MYVGKKAGVKTAIVNDGRYSPASSGGWWLNSSNNVFSSSSSCSVHNCFTDFCAALHSHAHMKRCFQFSMHYTLLFVCSKTGPDQSSWNDSLSPWIKFSSVGFNIPLDTLWIISETIFPADLSTGTKHPAFSTKHLADNDKTKHI